MFFAQRLNPVAVRRLWTPRGAAGHAGLQAGALGYVDSIEHRGRRVAYVKTEAAKLLFYLVNAAVPPEGNQIF